MTILLSIHFNNLDLYESSPNIYIRKVSDKENVDVIKNRMIDGMIKWNVNDPGNYYLPTKLSTKHFDAYMMEQNCSLQIHIFDTLEINAKFRVSEYNKRLKKIRKELANKIEAKLANSTDLDTEKILMSVEENLLKTVSTIHYHYTNNNSNYDDWYIYDGKNLICEEKYPKCKKDKIIL